MAGRSDAARQAAAVIDAAKSRGERTLSEYDSKRILAAYAIPVTREVLVSRLAQARDAAKTLGYPVVLKACAAEATHKTEKGLVAVNLSSDRALGDAFRTINQRAGPAFTGGFLVQQMIRGEREVAIGMIRDEQFGPSVMFGLGGIFTEVLEDVVFRIAPVRKRDALEMVRSIRGHKLLEAIRGMPAVDLAALTRSIVALGRIGLDHPEIEQIDVNPMIVTGADPVAVDALVVLGRRWPRGDEPAVTGDGSAPSELEQRR